MSRTTDLNGKVALITGAANGIGADTARALAARGARLVLTDIDAAALDQIAHELGGDVLAQVADVTDLGQMEDVVAAATARFGGLDLVLANAGIASYGSVAQVDPADFKRVIDINLLGVFHTARAALSTLIERKGYLLVVSSLAAFAPAPGLAAYNASKAGVEHFAYALRLEVGWQGVGVGTAHMSWIDTPMVQDAKKDLGAFRTMLKAMPYPMSKTTDVDTCVAAVVEGLERRSRVVYIPGWVGALAQGRAILSSRVTQAVMNPKTKKLLPQMDAEVRALGRSTSARFTRTTPDQAGAA